MDYKTVIENRHTTFAWDTENVPTKQQIMDVIEEAWTHIPSKNLQFPYQIHLLRNDDPVIRKEIMTICKRNQGHTVEEDRGNPQVLAPWLIGFSARYVADLEIRYEPESTKGILDGEGLTSRRTKVFVGDTDIDAAQTQTENIEIGLMSAFIMLGAANAGIQTGMCQNIDGDFARAEEIFNTDADPKSLDFRFMMGIGFGKDPSIRHNYHDPRTGTDKPIPFAPTNVHDFYPRPALTDILKEVKND